MPDEFGQMWSEVAQTWTQSVELGRARLSPAKSAHDCLRVGQIWVDAERKWPAGSSSPARPISATALGIGGDPRAMENLSPRARRPCPTKVVEVAAKFAQTVEIELELALIVET